jgi:CRP/FNR family transcriptional regulator, cyclic AMP receptor protein
MQSPYGLCTECIDCHLRPDNFFCALSQASLTAFKQIRHEAVFPENAVVFLEGQAPRGIFMLCEGQAKLCASASNGKTFILRIAMPGELLGLHAVVAGTPYEETVETMKPCRLNFVSSQDFLRFLKEHGDACLRAAQHIGRDCHDAYEVVRSVGLSHSISARVAKFLLVSVADGQVTNGSLHTRFVLTHEDIAQLMGTTRESITRTLSDFKRNNIAELKGSSLILHDKAALERLVTS